MKLNKLLFYILNLTWGLPLTVVGLIVTFILLCLGKRPHRHGGCWYFEIGQTWGGLELGLCFVVGAQCSEHLKHHEYGHAIQNSIYGPFTILVVCIPSMIRYWVHTIRDHYNKPNPPYDSIWFEGQATKWGIQTIEQWKI